MENCTTTSVFEKQVVQKLYSKPIYLSELLNFLKKASFWVTPTGYWVIILFLDYQSLVLLHASKINLSYTFVALPLPCSNKCLCYYKQSYGANVYDCTNQELRILPQVIPKGTNWVILQANKLTTLCAYPYSRNVTYINLASNNLIEICPAFISKLEQRGASLRLDLSNNSLSAIPKTFEKWRTGENLWLGGNPFLCNCDMLWMVNWLANYTTSHGEQVVQDYERVTCYNDDKQKKSIIELNQVDMGCYPDRLPSWEIAVLIVAGVLLITTGIVMFLVFRRWNEVKFWLYKHFDILDKSDKGEDLDGIKFDALLSYR